MAAKTKDSEHPASFPGTIALIQESWELYKVHFRAYWPLYLIFGLNGGVISLVNNFTQTHTSLPFPFNILVTVITTAVSIYITINLILALHKKAQQITILDNQVFSKFWPIVGVTICYYLIVLGGLLLLIIPGILFLIWYMFANYVLLTENLGIGESLKKSKQYIKGHFGEVFRRQFSVFVLYLLVYYLIGTIVGLLLQPFGTIPTVALNIISAILTIPFYGVIGILTTIYWFQLYTHLKSLPHKTK